MLAAANTIHVAILGESEDDWLHERELLAGGGYAYRWLDGARSARSDLLSDPLDLLIVDWDVAGPAAVDAAARARARFRKAPSILAVAASGGDRQVAEALERGADDGVARPVDAILLLARVRAMLRRQAADNPAPIDLGPYVIDRASRVMSVRGAAAGLTAREFDLACLLFDNAGSALSRTYLLDALWGYGANVSTRTLDTHISRIRTKLQLEDANGVRLTAHYGYGYQLDVLTR